MSVNVNFYTFVKRENSTKVVSSSPTTFACTFIDDTSLMNPKLKLSISSNPIGYNYCYIADFGRYYFVREINTYQNFWHITLEEDVLATFKTEIGTGQHYVLRSASNYDEYISDDFYGGKVKESATKLPQSGILWWATNHSYIVGITGYAPDTSKQVGSVTYYQMDDIGLYNFIYFLMHNINDWCDIPTALYDDGVKEALLNPIQYIVSAIAVPVGFPTTYTQPTDIYFGYYNWTIQGSGHYRVVSLGETKDEIGYITLPKHPQASTRGKYLNGAPFSAYTFHLGPFGDIPLDPADYIDAEQLEYKITYDLCQGMGRLMVGPKEGSTGQITNVSYCGSAQIGAPIQLAQAVIDPLNAQLSWDVGINSVFATGLGSINEKVISNLLNAQNTLQTTYADAIRNKYPQVSGVGSPGSFLSFFDDEGCYLLYKYFTIVDEDLEEIGRPLCQKKTINTLSGYILCQNADCQISGTQAEAQKINDYMNSGFFYE